MEGEVFGLLFGQGIESFGPSMLFSEIGIPIMNRNMPAPNIDCNCANQQCKQRYYRYVFFA